MQIAGLSLWLRAQRSWQAQGVKPQDRPRIQRSNIVCAEPMPGEAALLEEFLASLRADRLEGLIRRVLHVPVTQQVRATERMADALCDLVRVVWEEMKLAGEAGSLLKIEQTLANAVRAAEQAWSGRSPLLRVVEFGLTGEAERVRYPRSLPGEEGADFWQQAEALVLAALQDYAEQAQNGAGYQRRLFASDAARGFSFIDLCQKQYDVVLMNPPFGKVAAPSERLLRKNYPSNWKELYAAFMERAHRDFASGGYVGCITSSQFLYTKQMQDLRDLILTTLSMQVFVHLGHGVLDDAAVDTGISVLSASENTHSVTGTLYLDLKSTDGLRKMRLLSEAVTNVDHFTQIDLGLFERISTHPFSFHSSIRLLKLWQDSHRLQPSIGVVATGNHTFDDFRFLRMNTEIPTDQIGSRWRWFDKGGEYQPFYAATNLLLDWKNDGGALRWINFKKYGTDAQVMQSSKFWNRSGLCYSHVSSVAFGPRVLPANMVFSSESISIFANDDRDLLPLLGLLCSTLVQDLIWVFGRYRKIENRAVSNLPISRKVLRRSVNADIERATSQGISLLMQIESLDEVSPLYYLPDGISRQLRSPSREELRLEVQAVCDQIDALAATCLLEEPTWRSGEAVARSELTDYYIFRSAKSQSEFAHNHLSHLLGLIVGRWDVRNSQKASTASGFSDPFAPLPACPPGMLQNAHGLPAAPADVPAGYPLRISWPGILVDDPGHPEDIEARVRDALRVIWPASADAIEQEACQILGVGSLREYFANPSRFFDDHLKRYSKSRRQAPIYWPLSTRSGSYTLWLYYHRLSDQMLYSCVNDFVEPRLRVIADQLTVIRRKASRSREEERELERLSEFEIELREFRDELLRVAAFWKPNLNDGVQITAAPLWRLFRHRAWQRRLKETWEQLEAGAYDWAHLALSIWPARVVPKCVTDRSLAIAHDLEDVFWVEDPPGKWRTLAAPDQELAGQVERRRSPARERLRDLLGELARGRARGLRCADVAEELATGRWDDLEAALLLWPQRVAEACWDDPLLAVTLQITLPTQRTKAARERWVKERAAAGCPDLAEALIEALAGRPDRFAAFWAELARGDHDHLSLALALWPARVVETCAVDVELAARHDVRRFLWVRGGEGVWRRRMEIDEERKWAIRLARKS